MSLGRELDLAMAEITRRITCVESVNTELCSKYEFVRSALNKVTDRGFDITDVESKLDDTADQETVLGIESSLTSQIQMLEAELNDRIDEVENDMGFDPDDLRCDFESQIEEVRDTVSYHDDRLDDIECYKITEDEARDIATDVVRDEISDVISDYVNDVVCEEVNNRAIGYTEWSILVDRVKELEDRLNKPSLGARALRWLREGPSIKEVATNWYAGIRRGS